MMTTMMLERDMNALTPSSCSLSEDGSADYGVHDANPLELVQVHSHEDPFSIDTPDDEIHFDTFLHIHDEVAAMNNTKDKCIQEDKCMQCACAHIDAHQRTACTNMDVFDHPGDCSPPLLDSSDTSSAGPLSSLDTHPYPADLLAFFQGSDPVKEEIDRLQNEVKEKNRELLEARTEIKALKIAERSREKALEELADELTKVDERLARAELLLENKNLELKRMIEEKRAAQTAQHAAEAVVRRIQSTLMRDEELPPIEAILAPLDAELKLTRQEVARLQEDNRALDRLTKSKEAALVEAERMVEIATSKASLVDDLQNKNQELMKRIECCQEENKVLDKLHRQKVTEVEKLSLRVLEMEELLLSSGPNEANAARDYQRQLHQLQEEKKALERELARAKITANRVAAVVANGWKGSNDNKVMPVKHWLEERRLLQSEMEQLREKLASMEKAAKAEAVLKEKVQMRLKVLEESVMLNMSSGKTSQARKPGSNIAAASTMPRHAALHSVSSFKSISVRNQISTSIGRTLPENMLDEQVSGGRKLLGRCSSAHGYLLQKSMQSFSESFNALDSCDMSPRQLDGEIPECTQIVDTTLSHCHSHAEEVAMINTDSEAAELEETVINKDSGVAEQDETMIDKDSRAAEPDCVSGHLYDLLQKEVIVLRKSCQQKDCSLSEKENVIEMLEKKVCSLNRSMEIESKKLRREVSILEKEVATLRTSASTPRTPLTSKHKKSIVHPQPSN